jgi:transcriptional regulator with XRE-family HTH domain
MEATTMSTGQRLRMARIRIGLTQEGLADRAGVMRATVIRAENDRVHPQPMTIHKLASALDIDVAKLV